MKIGKVLKQLALAIKPPAIVTNAKHSSRQFNSKSTVNLNKVKSDLLIAATISAPFIAGGVSVAGFDEQKKTEFCAFLEQESSQFPN